MNEVITQAAAGDPWSIVVLLPYVVLGGRYLLTAVLAVVPEQEPGTWGYLAVQVAKVLLAHVPSK